MNTPKHRRIFVDDNLLIDSFESIAHYLDNLVIRNIESPEDLKKWFGFDIRGLVKQNYLKATSDYKTLITEDFLVHFIAIPTVIRSRLTTDTSAMSSLVNSQVILVELINKNQALVKLNGKKLVVDRFENKNYKLKDEYKLLEEDGKLLI